MAKLVSQVYGEALFGLARDGGRLEQFSEENAWENLQTLLSADTAVLKGLSVEEGMQRFEEEGGAEWSQIILDSLNNLNN